MKYLWDSTEHSFPQLVKFTYEVANRLQSKFIPFDFFPEHELSHNQRRSHYGDMFPG